MPQQLPESRGTRNFQSGISCLDIRASCLSVNLQITLFIDSIKINEHKIVVFVCQNYITWYSVLCIIIYNFQNVHIHAIFLMVFNFVERNYCHVAIYLLNVIKVVKWDSFSIQDFHKTRSMHCLCAVYWIPLTKCKPPPQKKDIIHNNSYIYSPANFYPTNY